MRDYPTDSRNFVAGLLTNILWLVYFIFIFLMNNQHPFITCAFVFLGAIALRALGSSRVAQADTWQGFLFRLVVVLALAGAYYIAPFVPGFV
jgi:hypothetical protein